MPFCYNPLALETDKDKLQELLETRAMADQALEERRTPMTILFSDIKGSTAYADKKGDVAYLHMINRHNRLLFPVIEREGGTVVKTIGDAILAKFDDPVSAVKASVGMQRVLAVDSQGKEEIDQIRIRIGLHHGLGLFTDKGDDVFGDVVNAASRVEHQAEAEQILITDGLIDAAKSAGFECAKMGRVQLKGKDDPIDLYAVAWSESATQQLIEEVQTRYERKFKELKKKEEELEEDFENARGQWRTERRTLNAEIEQLEELMERARQTARQQISEDLQSELRFQIEEAIRARQQTERELVAAQQKFEVERNNLKAQIVGMQAGVVDAMERANNPARVALTIREQVESRLSEAQQEWQLQWSGERRRLLAEIERLKKGAAPGAVEEKKEAARRALLEKLGKLPAGSGGAASRTADQWEQEFEDAKIQWETDREHLNLKIRKLEMDLQLAQDGVRAELFQELQAQYEPKLAEASRERQRLELEAQAATSELSRERQRLNARIEQLERAIPEAQESARKQALAELQGEYDMRIEEANRARARLERKQQDLSEEFSAEQRRAKKQIASLQEQLKEAKDAVYNAQKGSGRGSSPSD